MTASDCHHQVLNGGCLFKTEQKRARLIIKENQPRRVKLILLHKQKQLNHKTKKKMQKQTFWHFSMK